jgi:hypothetical protein
MSIPMLLDTTLTNWSSCYAYHEYENLELITFLMYIDLITKMSADNDQLAVDQLADNECRTSRQAMTIVNTQAFMKSW